MKHYNAKDKKVIKLKALTVACMFAGLSGLALNSAAEENERPYSIFATTGQYFFDNDLNVDDDFPLTLGLGYDFSSKWGGEVSYTKISTELENAVNTDVDVEHIQLDGLYYLGDADSLRTSTWKPYLVGGVGKRDLEVANFDNGSSFVNLGAGAKARLAERLQFRGDVRAYHDLDDSYTDYGVNLGLAYLFGSQSTVTKSSKPVAAQPAPANVEPAFIDSDKDGVEDAKDNCSQTPAGVSVDRQGCPIDSDKDGVADYLDQCADTKPIYKVDAKGCAQSLAETVTVSLNVKFGNNSDKLTGDYSSQIQELADFMNKFSDTSVVVEGYTDDRGNADYNQRLSQKRAEAVRNELINQYSISADRVSAKGYGEANPIASNDTAEGRAKNRRVVAQVSSSVEKIIEK